MVLFSQSHISFDNNHVLKLIFQPTPHDIHANRPIMGVD